MDTLKNKVFGLTPKIIRNLFSNIRVSYFTVLYKVEILKFTSTLFHKQFHSQFNLR